MTTKPIVVGTDGSAESIRAVEWAAREAELHDTTLRIVSAAELLPRMYSPPYATDPDTVADALRRNHDWALGAAAHAADAMEPGLLIDTDLLHGPPAVTVTDAGAGALMLVIGSRGIGAFSAMVLGSVGRYAAIHAACPVVVVREETMAAHRRIIVGIRDPQDCATALAFGFEEAQLRNASLLAVHAWQSPRTAGPHMPPLPDRRPADAQPGTELEELLNDWHHKYPEVAASYDVVHGHPGRVLADLSARADLVVLGRHARHGRALPGPARVAHAVLNHAHGPVVTVPAD
ncbi:MAG TPA: universal stress protein [Streptosporangiaceae bacterium]